MLAAPYIKADALTRLLDVTQSDASIHCITRWNPQDLISGASDIESRTLVLQSGGQFLLHPSLHAKYYRIDHTVLLGSANLTLSALGWRPQPNLEILCGAGADFNADEFENELLSDSREISDKEFSCWKAVVETNHPSHDDSNLYPRLDDWRPKTRDPRHVFMSYQGRNNQIASFDEQEAVRVDLRALLIPPSFTDEEIHAWMSTCLLAAPFTNSVIKFLDNADLTASYQSLASKYGLGLTEARRDMETVQNWLAYFSTGHIQ